MREDAAATSVSLRWGEAPAAEDAGWTKRINAVFLRDLPSLLQPEPSPNGLYDLYTPGGFAGAGSAGQRGTPRAFALESLQGANLLG